MSRRQSPNEAQPIEQRLRIRYAKTGRMRFASHRDFQRALERAVRRAGLPIAFSGGFNPHPRIAYANAAPTGAASHAEFVQLGMARRIDASGVAEQLSVALPEGLDITECREVESKSVAEGLEASLWQLELTGTDAAQLAAGFAALEGAADVEVQRTTKTGVKQIPVGAAITWGEVTDGEVLASGGGYAILQVVVRHVTPSVRPEDVLSALVEHTELQQPVSVVYTRLAQGPLMGDPPTVLDQISGTGQTSPDTPPE